MIYNGRMKSKQQIPTEEVSTTSSVLLQEIDDQIYFLQKAKARLKAAQTPAHFKPTLALPRLLADRSDIDLLDRSHIKLQTEQIIGVMRILTNPNSPLVHSTKIKEFILRTFEIPFPEYWMAKSGPKETERWWKHIYDKAIERMDVQDGLIVRKKQTGKKGMYALTEYYVKALSQPELDFQPLKIRLRKQKMPAAFYLY